MITGRLQRHRQGARAEGRRGGGRRWLLVARSEEKLQETKAEIEEAGGEAHDPPGRPVGPRGLRPAGRGGARRARTRGRPGQQRRPLDPALGRELLRPLPRLPAHDAAQLLRRAEADHGLPAEHAQAQGAGTSSTSPRSARRRTRRASRPTSQARARSTRSRGAIASEIVDDKVHITTVYMPLVRTPMIAPTGMYDAFPTDRPDEAADMIATR